MFALFTIAVAAAEVGIGLAIVLLMYRNRRSIDLTEADLHEGLIGRTCLASLAALPFDVEGPSEISTVTQRRQLVPRERVDHRPAAGDLVRA